LKNSIFIIQTSAMIRSVIQMEISSGNKDMYPLVGNPPNRRNTLLSSPGKIQTLIIDKLTSWLPNAHMDQKLATADYAACPLAGSQLTIRPVKAISFIEGTCQTLAGPDPKAAPPTLRSHPRESIVWLPRDLTSCSRLVITRA